MLSAGGSEAKESQELQEEFRDSEGEHHAIK